jgi:hypothetical protein
MSTPTPARDTARTAHVPSPRRPVEPPVDAPVDATIARRPSNRQIDDTEPVGYFGRNAWLAPAVCIACVIAVFVSMVVLTWLAGGPTPFDR